MEASDVHLVSYHPPVVRRHGTLSQLNDESIPPAALREILGTLLPDSMGPQFEVQKNVDFSITPLIAGKPQRFRVNLFQSRGEIGACFRIIPSLIPDFDWAGFPQEVARRLTGFRNGLVLITGVAGSGKSTSLAMLINQLNQDGGYRIITVEEPVEYLFPRITSSVVTQREVGQDVNSFADGLKYGLRQDPDVILVGEIRDRETAQMALSAAETGHMVFSTMHTRDAKGAISRYADLFPQAAQNDVRAQLALSLRAVISQHLLPSVDPESKRELALEIMFNNHPISSAIRFGKLESIDNCILTGRSEGMLPLDESVRRLYQSGRIGYETALRFVSSDVVLARPR
jgi:twitching motility protein PilT